MKDVLLSQVKRDTKITVFHISYRRHRRSSVYNLPLFGCRWS